jgi:hypothetical protein
VRAVETIVTAQLCKWRPASCASETLTQRGLCSRELSRSWDDLQRRQHTDRGLRTAGHTILRGKSPDTTAESASLKGQSLHNSSFWRRRPTAGADMARAVETIVTAQLCKWRPALLAPDTLTQRGLRSCEPSGSWDDLRRRQHTDRSLRAADHNSSGESPRTLRQRVPALRASPSTTQALAKTANGRS